MDVPRSVKLLLIAVVAASSAACGGASGSTSKPKPAGEGADPTIGGYGLSIDLADGWRGCIFKRDSRTAVVLRAANFPIYLGTSIGLGGTSKDMPESGIFVELYDAEIPLPNSNFPATTLPIEVGRPDFGRFEGVAAPGYALRHVAINGRSITLGVGFGIPDPSDALLSEANRFLATLQVDRDSSKWGGDAAHDPVPYVRFSPEGGRFTAETSLSAPQGNPIPVAWAGTVPFVDDPAGDGLADATIRHLPADGIVVETVGPRPYTGDAGFPTRNLPLRLSDGYCNADGYEGQPAPNVSFCEIDTQLGPDVLNVMVWFGRNEPSQEMTGEANDVLSTLSISS